MNIVPMTHPKKANNIELQSIGGCADLTETKAEGLKTPPIINVTKFINIFLVIEL